ncbi:unnamed protein product [Chilo suppressalis]|uniref:Carboxylic ester hydrolase n=2 Tax=Chilo suppressalis TaxID=168631 RepID=A0ABN8B422_CHISP|nr:unnamed protein product [Chilo suppressalis]
MVVSVMKWVALTTLIATGLVQIPSPVVRVSSGLLRGRLDPGGTFYQYLGVPYATVDETNRFKAPLPPPTWNGVFEAINDNTWCPQMLLGSAIRVGFDPNCLKLNIYSPVTSNSESLLPVMIYIHGGSFIEGAGNRFLYAGDYFTLHGVIFVGINYRLNVEGFLCLGIKEAPGNTGLRDQIAALKWIKNNIKLFGGDPDNVTVFGESAGASSVSFLMLSPAARGLFHKVIMQSGSSVTPWSMQYDPLETASKLVYQLGYRTKDPYEMYDIISKKSHFELVKATTSCSETKYLIMPHILFGPCVENEIEGVEPILTGYPLDIINSGNYTKVPMIVGNNNKEGIFFVSLDYGKNVKEVDVVEHIKKAFTFPSERERNVTAEKIQKFYFSSGKEDLVMRLIDLYSDMYYKFPIRTETALYARTTDQPIYFYNFKYSGYMNIAKFSANFASVVGASHGDELFYMMRSYLLPFPERWLENTTRRRMLTMWTNFAKFSDPTPAMSELLPVKWLPSREWNPAALVIDSTFTIAPLWDEPSMTFWNDTYNKYRRKYIYLNKN